MFRNKAAFFRMKRIQKGLEQNGTKVFMGLLVDINKLMF